MLRVTVVRDERNIHESQVRWPQKEQQPYYKLEKRFTDKKGTYSEGGLNYYILTQITPKFLAILPFQAYPSQITSEYGYLESFLDEVYQLRDYKYSFHSHPWSGDLPTYFRKYGQFVSDNRRHGIINCAEYDRDPRGSDMSCISAWGTGLGKAYTGEWGVVTNRSTFGSWYSEADANGQYHLIHRQNANDFRLHGKP